jgi:hypothetical protein
MSYSLTVGDGRAAPATRADRDALAAEKIGAAAEVDRAWAAVVSAMKRHAIAQERLIEARAKYASAAAGIPGSKA